MQLDVRRLRHPWASAPVPSPSAAQDAHGAQDGSDRPVFVDATGRRGKSFRRLGWVLAAGCACFAVTLVVSVLGGSSAAPSLPVPDPAERQDTGQVLDQPAPGAAPGAVPPSDGTTGSPSPSATPLTGQPSGSATGQPSGSPDGAPADVPNGAPVDAHTTP
ncbi:hypothetical protein [Streptomyces sp. NPDC050504]|uniref:hypothetical protein n=1 Tax=Streptomyces sp. NPDC050504 TaxID=3365618 RepID=UPI0037B4CC1C